MATDTVADCRRNLGRLAFGADFGALSQDFVVAHQHVAGSAPRVVGVCERVVREAFVNGERRRLPYLAALRVLPEFRNQLRALRGGFDRSGIDLVAEKVETEAQVADMLDLRADFGQGWVFGEPRRSREES